LLIKYIKSVLWRVVKRLSYKEDARCLKVKVPLTWVGRKRGQTWAWKWHTAADCNIGTSSPQWTLSTLTVTACVDWRLLMLEASGRSCACVQPTVRSYQACSLHYRDVFINSSPQIRMFG